MKQTNLVLTESMLLTDSRLPIVEEIVRAEEEKEQQYALRRLCQLIEHDLEQLLYEAKKSPLAVRLPEHPLPRLLSNWKQSNDVEDNEMKQQIVANSDKLGEVVDDMLLEALFRAWLSLRSRGEYRIPVVVLPTGGMHQEEQIQDLTNLVAKQVLGEDFKYCHFSVEQEASLLA